MEKIFKLWLEYSSFLIKLYENIDSITQLLGTLHHKRLLAKSEKIA